MQSICTRASRPITRGVGLQDNDADPKVFISYQWDVQDKVYFKSD